MQKNRWIMASVGLFVLFAIAGVFFLGFKASNLGKFQVDKTYSIRAQFGDVSGLGKQASVFMSGVQIGRVTSITLNPKTAEAEVAMIISRDVELPTDSVAKILTSGLLGDKYIGIQPGIATEMIHDGEQLKRTGGALVLEKMLQQFSGSKGAFYPEDSYTVTARFNDATGLQVDSPVTLAGVQIGQVKSISLDQETFQAVAALEIASDFDKIPSDSSADILSTSLIGGKYIGISPGGDSIMLEDGGEIMYTTSTVVLEKLISQFVTNMGSK